MRGLPGSWIEAQMGTMRLGEILVDHRVINNAQLKCTLPIAKEKGMLIGETLIDLGLATLGQVQVALDEQQRMEVT